MKNSQKGFIIPLVIIIITLLAISAGTYFYVNKKLANPPTVDVSNNINNVPSLIVNKNSKKASTTTIDQNAMKANKSTTAKPTTSYSLPNTILTILKPNANETWEIGVPYNIQWKLDTDFTRLHGTLSLSVQLQNKLGNIISANYSHNISKNTFGSSTISIPYNKSDITPGLYRLIFTVIDYDEVPCNSGGEGASTNCMGYSPVIASTTSLVEITLTPSSGHVPPYLSPIESNKIRLGDTVSLNGVAFQPDSKVIFEGGYRSGDTWPMKIVIVPQFISSKLIRFVVPVSCSSADICVSQDVKMEPYVYRITIETKYGTSNASVLYLQH